MEDFTGFTFGGVHSSDLGIIRVSGGDRYEEQLHPEIKDRTAEVPGLNGDYYFGSDFGPKSFDIEIAFDSLTEEQFRKLRRVFGTKEIKQLIFDERPYKYYMAKLESPMELSYVCFDEPNYTWEKVIISHDLDTQQPIYAKGIGGEDYEHKVYDGTTRRIYKGEGRLTFVCHYPFAKSVYKQIANADEESSWAVSSGILFSNEREGIDEYDDGTITIYNGGDLPTGFRLYLSAEAVGANVHLTYLEDNSNITAVLNLEKMTPLETEDIGVLIDTNSGLIIGVSSFNLTQTGAIYETSGHLYNQFVTSGQFFKLEPHDNRYDRSTLQIDGISTGDVQIFYDYLYF
jgi:predicted phage tail component-like protein